MPTPLAEGLRAYRRLVRRKQHIARALTRMERALKKKANVTGYAVGLKKKGKRHDLAAIFYVTRKVPLKKLKKPDRLPASIRVKGKRVLTDVVVLKALVPLANNAANIARQRPMNIGAQIEAMIHDQNVEVSPDGYGTAGAVLKRKDNNALVLLSCGHVLHAMDDDLIQPSMQNGQGNATLADKQKHPPDFKDAVGGVRKIAGGGVDAGYAETSATTTIIGIGPYTSIQPSMPGLPVIKSGATTGVTEGHIDNDDQKIFNRLANVLANTHPQIFAGQKPSQLPSLADLFLVKPATFGSGGDSGSLVVVGPEAALEAWINDQAGLKNLKKAAKDALKAALLHSAVGLLCFSGVGRSVGYAGFIGQKLQAALDALNCDLVT